MAYALIDPSTEEGRTTFMLTLEYLLISYEDFVGFLKGMPRNEEARLALYRDIRRISPVDKETVRYIIVNALENGGKSKDEDAIYYFKEMINECDLASGHISL